EKTCVAGAVPAVVGARLLGRVGLFVVAREQATRTDEHFAVFGDAHLHAGAHAPDRVGIRLPVRLDRGEPGQLGRAVYLFEVDAEGAKEPIGMDAEWRAAGIGPARAAQAELIAHRRVDKDFAQRESKSGRERDRLAVVARELRALGEVAEELEQAALER